MDDIIKSLCSKFNSYSEEIMLIKEYKTNKEDWFIVNVISLLDNLKKNNEINDFSIEYKTKENKSIDLQLLKNNVEYFIEFKHWRDKYKNGKNFALSSWFSDGGKFISSDLEKLKRIKNEYNRCYLIIFYTHLDDTEENIKTQSEKFSTRNAPMIYSVFRNDEFYILLFEVFK